MKDKYVITCEHVLNNYPILFGARDVPIDDDDSGWQFLCNTVESEPEGSAKLCFIQELIEMDPSLQEIINLSAPVEVIRDNSTSPWRLIVPD